MTLGRWSLLALLQRLPAREVAARCGVSPAAVSQWASGLKVPSHAMRAELARHCGIALEAWKHERGRSCPLSAKADSKR